MRKISLLPLVLFVAMAILLVGTQIGCSGDEPPADTGTTTLNQTDSPQTPVSVTVMLEKAPGFILC